MTALVVRGDAMALPLPDASVDLVVTSPPYFALRSYRDGGEHYAGQVGDEATPREYVEALLAATREMIRVVKPTGSIFVNLGDKYASGGRTTYDPDDTSNNGRGGKRPQDGARPKSLLGMPWRYALGCIDELGLILRAELVWSKPNGLPESVTDRVRRSHEQWFHFTKEPCYYSSVDAIREPHSPETIARAQRARTTPHDAPGQTPQRRDETTPSPLGKLPGSVWEIATQPLTVPAELGVDHYAAFPMEWPRRLILGWSPSGTCTACGQGRRPRVASVALNMHRPQARRAQELADRAGLTEEHFAALVAVGVSDTGRGLATQTGTGRNTERVYALADEARSALGGYAREYLLRRPVTFDQACACPDTTAPTRPAVVLDPFGGTGTTALVASALGRVGVTVDRSSDYCRLTQWRTSDRRQIASALRVPRAPEQTAGQTSLFDPDSPIGERP